MEWERVYGLCAVTTPVLCTAYTLVVRMLLLLSGDVERNPGPTVIYPEHVDELVELLADIAASWDLFLGQLEVPVSELDQIRNNNAQKNDFCKRCLLDGIHHLVQSKRKPTFERIAKVLHGRTVTNVALAESVEQFAVRVTSTSDIHYRRAGTHYKCRNVCAIGVVVLFLAVMIPMAPMVTIHTMSPIQGYERYLKTLYLSKNLPDQSKWPPTPSKRYISLSCVKKEVRIHEANNFTTIIIREGIDNVFGIKMELKEIANMQQKNQLILVEGAPGVGKTTFAWELCRKWASGEILTQYSLVVLLTLRSKRIKEAKELADLFYPAENDKILATEVMQTLGKNVMFLLEGFDELPENLKEDSIFTDLVTGSLLPSATVLVTSRPWASADIHSGKYKQRLTQHVEILGFTTEQIEEYVISVAGDDSELLSGLQNYMSLNPPIQAVMYIPLNAAIVVEIYRQNRKSIVPKTMTQLYTALTNTLLLRYLSTHPEHGKLKWRLRSLEDLPADVLSQFNSLCKLAYDGIYTNDQQLVFDLPSDFESLGFMQTVAEVHISEGMTLSYNFLHLTVQEYLAAVYISQMPPDEHTKHYMEGAYCKSNVFRFLSGKIKLKTIPPILLEVFTLNEKLQFSNFLLFSKEYITIYDGIFSASVTLSQNIIQWLYETQTDTVIQQATGDKKTMFTKHINYDHPNLLMSAMDYYSLGYCIAHSISQWTLHLDWSTTPENIEMISKGANSYDSMKSVITGIAGDNIDANSMRSLLVDLPNAIPMDLKELRLILSVVRPHGVIDAVASSNISTLTTLKLWCNPSMNEMMKLLVNPYDFTMDLNGIANIIQKNKLLEHITVVATPGGSQKQFFKALCGNTILKSLHLKFDISFKLELVKEFVQDLLLKPKLQELHLEGIYRVSQEVSDLIKKTKSLEILSLNFGINSEELASMLAALLENKTFKKIHLVSANLYIHVSNSTIGDQINSTRQAQGFSVLQELHVFNIPVDTTSANIIAAIITNASLKSLILRRCGIDDDKASVLARALSNSTKLEELDLSGNGISARGVRALSKSLSSNTALEKLNLSSNGISSQGIVPLAKALSTTTRLKELYLSFNNISTEGTLALANMLTLRTSLKLFTLVIFEPMSGDRCLELALALKMVPIKLLRIPSEEAITCALHYCKDVKSMECAQIRDKCITPKSIFDCSATSCSYNNY